MQVMADTMLSPLLGRVGSMKIERTSAVERSLGKASLTEMESDLAAVDGLKSSVLVKLQELSISVEPRPVRRRRKMRCRVLQSAHSDAGGTRHKRLSICGIHFRSASMKDASSFWSEPC